ncbi:ABC transporter permease [Jatrophihabitans endophyticus]|uniref:ABC transporter permease n=1 Tax=Jatrophihabitans endophyticus TaxID=1206085 RepID=UPI0019DCBEBC|nr:ABC transporter permease [Jatrophihabitans endophyticus]MBE7189081.1 ABC transporter permease [Jatrophihabitans endophyticus]
MSNTFIESFKFIGDNHAYILNRLYSHLEIAGVAMGIALAIGLPIGLLLGHVHRFSFLAINISNLGRALPSVGILALFLPVVGVGVTDVIIALVILAFPPILTNTYVAVDQVDVDTVDAARGLGLRGWQVLTKVELPLALPLIFAGIRTSTVFAIATATLAGFFGGGGLGDIIANQASFKLQGVLGATYVLIALAFVSQLVFLAIERAVTPAGLKINQRRNRFRSRPGSEVIINQDGGEAVEDEISDVASSPEPATR